MEKLLKVIVGRTAREVVLEVNKLQLQKDDIVQILCADKQFMLFYYI